MLNEDELRESILLVFANKQDLPNAMSAAEMTDKLGLHGLRQRQWYARTHVACHYYAYTAIVFSSSVFPASILLQREFQIVLTTSPISPFSGTSKRVAQRQGTDSMRA